MDDESDDDTFQYNGGSVAFDESQTIAMPLTEKGSNYFFSDTNDGIQCQNGLAFGNSVNHGLELLPNLNQPSPLLTLNRLDSMPNRRRLQL
ncbi:hypothetical protein SLEP1_g12190 [Rubroshorea leprosula]|uniref:Uncharacterized protein n=1 Tax=Rubroshorea leprosula TaxID=152421 RepID=A0AAV5ILT4_9ROSI|nr:hypothetical protein SLEP1_g12190 [Rubroshorea leprosula]